MRDRVLAQLSAAASGAEPSNDLDRTTRPLALAALENDRRHGWSLLEHPDRLNISTIDSLCTRLANSLPVLSGAGGLTPIDRANGLHSQAARRTLARLGLDPALTLSLRTLLLHRDNNLADTETLIAGMLNTRDQWANLIPLTGEQLTDEYLETVTLPRLEKALEQVICRALTRLDHVMPPDLCKQLSTFAQEMSHSPGYNGAENPLAICRKLALNPGTAAESLDHWKLLARLLLTKGGEWRSTFNKNHVEFEIEKHHKAELKALVDRLRSEPALQEALCALTELPPLAYPQHQWFVAKALFRVLSHALVELQLVFAEASQCDFTEFSLTALRALRADTAFDDLANTPTARPDHLLIDEMQDTSSSQYELIRLLTQSWDAHSQTVFLVGDPKQSIYLFRQARVERFLDLLRTHRLGDLPLTPLHLTANFRSQAALVDAFNQTFTAIFPPPANVSVPHPRATRVESEAESDSPESIANRETEDPKTANPDTVNPDTVTYRQAHAARSPAQGPNLVWHPAPIPSETEDKAAEHKLLTDRNANTIRQLIDQWRARPLPPGRTAPWKIAILARNRSHLHEVTKALAPNSFQAINVVPLGERQEVLDLLALTRALLHPADRTAWLALLRTPWCGITLADLHQLAGDDGQHDPTHREATVFELLRDRGALLSSDGIARLKPFWLILESALAHRGQLPLSQWVARTAHAFAANDFLDPTQQANAHSFFQRLEELEALPEPVTIDALSRAIDELYAKPSTPDDTIQMMTIHGAKGLEWDFVVVPQMESGAGQNRGQLLAWLDLEHPDDDTVAHGMIAPVQARGDETHPLNKWMNKIRSARETAEVKRLFYVAATRAREELHLFAAPKRLKSGEIERRPKTLLQAAWPAAALEFEKPEPALLADLAASLVLIPTPPPRTLQRIPLPAFKIPAYPDPTSAVWQAHPTHASPPRSANPRAVNQRSADQRSADPQSANQRSANQRSGDPADRSSPARPEGSLQARALGNTTHTFLELLTQRIAAGQSFAALAAEIPTWSPRTQTLLRAAGLPPESLQQATTAILRALTQTLADPQGRWLLTPHPEASTESSISTPASGETQTIRLDRTFLAGPEPLTTGQTHLWIVDYKTGTHAAAGLDEFLKKQKEIYAPQLETYATHLSSRGLPICLALYYPTLPALLWWAFQTTNEQRKRSRIGNSTP
jgi:ATP-dependent helicase/nuclease subunit A